MTGLADVQLTGVFLNIFQGNLNCAPYIRHVFAAQDDEASMTAPSLCISGKFNRDYLCVGGLYCLVNCIDLAGSSGPGADESETLIWLFQIHLFEKRRVNSGNDEPNRIEHSCTDELCQRTVSRDFCQIIYIYHRVNLLFCNRIIQIIPPSRPMICPVR